MKKGKVIVPCNDYIWERIDKTIIKVSKSDDVYPNVKQADDYQVEQIGILLSQMGDDKRQLLSDHLEYLLDMDWRLEEAIYIRGYKDGAKGRNLAYEY
jgi:hypothetical protein